MRVFQTSCIEISHGPLINSFNLVQRLHGFVDGGKSI